MKTPTNTAAAQTTKPKLTAEQRAAVRSMMEDGGCSRAEAVAMVLGGVCS